MVRQACPDLAPCGQGYLLGGSRDSGRGQPRTGQGQSSLDGSGRCRRKFRKGPSRSLRLARSSLTGQSLNIGVAACLQQRVATLANLSRPNWNGRCRPCRGAPRAWAWAGINFSNTHGAMNMISFFQPWTRFARRSDSGGDDAGRSFCRRPDWRAGMPSFREWPERSGGKSGCRLRLRTPCRRTIRPLHRQAHQDRRQYQRERPGRTALGRGVRRPAGMAVARWPATMSGLKARRRSGLASAPRPHRRLRQHVFASAAEYRRRGWPWLHRRRGKPDAGLCRRQARAENALQASRRRSARLTKTTLK